MINDIIINLENKPPWNSTQNTIIFIEETTELDYSINRSFIIGVITLPLIERTSGVGKSEFNSEPRRAITSHTMKCGYISMRYLWYEDSGARSGISNMYKELHLLLAVLIYKPSPPCPTFNLCDFLTEAICRTSLSTMNNNSLTPAFDCLGMCSILLRISVRDVQSSYPWFRCIILPHGSPGCYWK